MFFLISILTFTHKQIPLTNISINYQYKTKTNITLNVYFDNM